MMVMMSEETARGHVYGLTMTPDRSLSGTLFLVVTVGWRERSHRKLYSTNPLLKHILFHVFHLVLHAGRRTTGNSARAPVVSTSFVTLVHVPLMLWTSGLSSAQSTTASHSGAGITNGSPTLKWTVSLAHLVRFVCNAKNTEEKSLDGWGATILWTKKHRMSVPFFVYV